MARLCNPLEADTRKLIDTSLENLGWIFKGKEKNVYLEQPRTEEERQALEHKRPDYVLYSKDYEPLIVIEAKKKGERIDSALEQGIFYAQRLKAPLVYATDGVFCKAFHVEANRPPLLNGNELDEFIRQALALRFMGNYEVNTISPKVQYSRQELIKIFAYANNLLRGEGLGVGLERFSEFSNILFLKLLSEKKIIDESCAWNTIKRIPISSRIKYINSTVYTTLNNYYNTEIFTPLEMKDNEILNEIMQSLDPLILTDIDSDIKGDAFEYFLRESTKAGNDLGQYFTPRHIVKTMVRLTNPQIGEKVYDPFCGTGGFLIESFRHIYNNMPRNEATEKMLRENTIFGNEISKTARITKMNMILAGDGHSGINRCDSLATPINGLYDVVLANMPYSQKTKWGALYDVPSKNGDSICVQHCMKAISATSENGRMALVVPEGFLFRKDLKKTREYLLENSELQSIISLPQGVFLPYTGVKTDIIYATKVNQKIPSSKKRKNYWYFEVKNDGFSLDNYRRKLDAQSDLQKYEEYRKLDEEQKEEMQKIGFDIIPFEKVKEKDFNFVGTRYRSFQNLKTKFEYLSLAELENQKKISFLKGQSLSKKEITDKGKYKCILYGELYTLYKNPIIGPVISKTNSQTKILSKKGDVLIPATTTADADGIAIARALNEDNIQIGSDINIIRTNNEYIDSRFLAYIFCTKLKQDLAQCARGTNIIHLSYNDFKDIYIPIPPLEIQEKIVKELEDYQNIIDGAKQVIENYKPTLVNLSSYPSYYLGEEQYFEIISGGTPDSKNEKYWNGEINWITLVDLPAEDYITNIFESERKITEAGLNSSNAKILPINSVVVSSRATIGRVGITRVPLATNQGFKNIIIKDKNFITPEFLAYSLREKTNEMLNLASGATFKEISKSNFETITINVPPIKIQKQIINVIGTEQELIRPAYQLIELFTQKIQDRINQLFEEK